MLPKNLKYGSKVESANCKSFRTNIQPQNGTGPYNLGDTITFNIPTRRNLVMVPSESYLKFSILITNTSTNPNYYRWDSCGAHGAISQVRVSHGSNQLENINIYGQLAKLMFDLQVNTPSSSGKFNILAGTRGDSMSAPSTAVTSGTNLVNGVAVTDAGATVAQLAAVLNSVLTIPVVATNSGDFLGAVTNLAGAPGNATATLTNNLAPTYCLNLISMCGSLCQNQYLPLFAMDSAPLRLDITLVDTISKMLSCVSSSGTIAVFNVEYVANMIELSDEAMMTIVNSLQGEPLQFVLPSWSNYQSTVAAGQTQINVPIPAKYSSVKSLFSCFRDQYNTALYMPYSSVSSGLSSYQYRIGSNLAPLKAPASNSEYFAEVLKAIGSMSDNYHSPAIDKFSYTLGASAQENATGASVQYPHTIQKGNISSGSFCVGLDLESFSNADKSSIFSGYNTNTDDIFLTLNYGTATTSQLRIDSYALFDQVLVCANSTAFVRF
jgi:hypothetical protein